MVHVHGSQRKVLLPRRLTDRTPSDDPGNEGPGDISQPNIWGLTERIETLPGVWSNRNILPHGMVATEFFVEKSFVPRQYRSKHELMCRIDANRIWLSQVSASDRDEILSQGWGYPESRGICVFIPRDRIEMEVAWRVILLAYRFITSPQVECGVSTKKRPVHGFASSAKYWM